MNFPEEYKLPYWICLLVLFLVVIIYRIFTGGLTSTIDIIIVFIWIALLLMPLFQEINIFGLKLKREIDNLRTDLSSQITSLRTEVQNSVNIGMNQKQDINIFNQSPPPDEELPKIEKNWNTFLDKYVKGSGFQKTPEYPDQEVSDDIKFLFSTRYLIENELRRIWYSIFDKEDPRSANRILGTLTGQGIINPEIARAIKDVLTVCNPAIHGEKVTDAQIRFVKDLGPEVISILKQLN